MVTGTRALARYGELRSVTIHHLAGTWATHHITCTPHSVLIMMAHPLRITVRRDLTRVIQAAATDHSFYDILDHGYRDPAVYIYHSHYLASIERAPAINKVCSP